MGPVLSARRAGALRAVLRMFYQPRGPTSIATEMWIWSARLPQIRRQGPTVLSPGPSLPPQFVGTYNGVPSELWLNDGTGVFTAWNGGLVSATNDVEGVVTEDVDGDGFLDVT